MSDPQSALPSSSTRRRATPPEPPTPLEAALASGAPNVEIERLLDRRDEFGDTALAEEVERADAEADVAILALLSRPALAERCWQPTLFAAARCGRSGLLQRLRDLNPAAWRRAVCSAGPDGRRVLHHAATGGQVEALLRLLRMLRMNQRQQPPQPENPPGEGENRDGVDDEEQRGPQAADEAEEPDSEDFIELVYAVDSRGRTFLADLADLHPQRLPELWPAELPGGLARVLELLDPPLVGLTDLPERPEALETVALAQPQVKRIVRSLSDLPAIERSDAARQLVRLSQSGSSPKLLPALLRLGLVRPSDCDQAFVLELVKAGWLTAAAQLMRLQQTRLVETCAAVAAACSRWPSADRTLGHPARPTTATPAGLAASAGRWLKSGEQAGADARVDSSACNRERLRRDAVAVALSAIDAVYSGADGHWKARIHRHFFAGSCGRTLALTDAAPELLETPAMAELIDRRWADGPDATPGCLGFGSPAGGPPRFAPRAKHVARLAGLLTLLMLLTAQATRAAQSISASWAGLEIVVAVWLPLQLAQELACPAWDGGAALPPLPPLAAQLLLPLAAISVSGTGLIVWAVASGIKASFQSGPMLASQVLLCIGVALWSARFLAALRPYRLAGLPVQQLLLALRRDCWPLAVSVLPAAVCATVPVKHLLFSSIVTQSGVLIASFAALVLFILLAVFLGARLCCGSLSDCRALAIARHRRSRLAAAEALTAAGCLPAPLNLAYAVPQGVRLCQRLRDRVTGRPDTDIEAFAALDRQGVYGDGCHGVGAGGDAVGGATGQLLLVGSGGVEGGAGIGGDGCPGAAHKEDRQFQLFQAAAFRGKRHTFGCQRPLSA